MQAGGEGVDPFGEEESRKGSDSVKGAAVGKVEVLTSFVHGRVETECTLVEEDGGGDGVEPVVGVGKIVVEVGRGVAGGKGGAVVEESGRVVVLTVGEIALLCNLEGDLGMKAWELGTAKDEQKTNAYAFAEPSWVDEVGIEI